jgi:phosphoribosylanthranilate isomerase
MSGLDTRRMFLSLHAEMVRVKVCGITNVVDALAAVEYGADALGFVFADGPRRITPAAARDIVDHLPPFVAKVGVFVDAPPDIVASAIETCRLDFVQLHGSETPAYCETFAPRVIKAFRVKDESVVGLLPQFKVAAYLLDTWSEASAGGTGHSFDWSIARKARSAGPVILSGGLNADNVTDAITVAKPYAVDASSGLEAGPGIKDHARMRAFIRAAKYGREEGLSASKHSFPKSSEAGK